MLINHYFYIILLSFSSLFANNITAAKLSLQCIYNDEIIDLAGLLNNQNSINKIIKLLEPAIISKESSSEPFIYRYPYDLSYSDTNAVWDTIVTSTNFFQQGIKDMAWVPDGNKLIVVGQPKSDVNSEGIVGRIYDFLKNGNSLYNDIYSDAKYTITWGGLNSTALTVSAVAVHPGGKHFMIGGVRTPSGVTHRLIYLDETLSSTVILQDFDHGSTVQSIDWSPNGNYVAVVGEVSSNINMRIYKFEYGTLTELPRCQYSWHSTNSLCSVKWHPTGNFIAIAGGISSSTHLIKVLSFNQESTSELIGARTTNSMTAGHVPDIAWSPDGIQLAAAHYSTVAAGPRLYSFINNLELSLYSSGGTSATQIHSISISPDGAYLSAGRSAQIDTYSYYDSAGTLVNILNFAFATSPIRKIRWNPDGNFLVFGADNGDIKVLKLNENNITLAKRIKKELLNMYLPAHQMYNTTQNILQPLSVASSNALQTYFNQTPLSYTKTFTTALSSQIVYDVDWSSQNNYAVASAFSNPQISLYQKRGDLLINKPLATISTGASINAVALSPNEKYLAAGSIAGAKTIIYNFNGYSLKSVLSTATGSNNLEWFADSSTILLNGGVYNFTGTALVIMNQTFRANADLDSTKQYIAFTTAPNTLNIARYSSAGVITVTTRPISGLETIGALAWKNPTTIFVAQTVSGNNIAALYFDGTSLTLIGTGVATGVVNAIAVDSLGRYGVIGINSAATTNVYEYSLTPSSSPIIQFTSMTHGTGTLVPFKIRYSPDNNYLIIGNSGSAESLSLYRRNLSSASLMSLASTYTIIKGTSDLLSDAGDNGENTLNIQTSYAIINASALTLANSNVLVTIDPLVKNNSNAIAGLLLATSNAIVNFVIPNSSAIVNAQALVVQNSYALIAKDTLIKTTSNALVTYQPLIVNTSNAISGLLVTTSYAATSLASKLIPLDTIDTGPSHIHFNAATITMSYNVLLSSDHQLFVHANGVVNGNGHSITFARGAGTQLTVDAAITTTFQNVIFKDYNEQATALGAGSSLIFGNNCRVEISEPQTLLRTWSFAGISQLNGLGNALTLGTGPRFLSTLISSSLQLSNLKLLNVRENNIRAANNNAQVFFQDVTLNMSADFTYSVGSMLVQNDLVIRGTSTFNYSTIMGLTVNPASQLTIDQGATFNYAPSGNFRNLLSLTDSSATLYFNYGSLAATATGPRLTKGTLLVDGIMNIQSSAVSTAQAIIFGDETPANDLMIKLMPSATINLLSGFLNYANAN